jgi:hypothetical protein
MNFKEYKTKALLTESKPETLNFGEIGLHVLLNAAIDMGEVLNLAKRTIFYGKEFDAERARALAENISGYGQLIYTLSDHLAIPNDRGNFDELPEEAESVDPKNVDLRLLHAALGIFTESTEALELVRDQLEGKPFDTVGWGEEIGGDISWYQALGHDAAGTDEDVEREKNIRKLELRNKGKTFNAEATINRDVEAERAILEGKA